MADDTVRAAMNTPQAAYCELRIDIWPDEFARYIGTAAQLQAEGLIPTGFDWPLAAASKQWEASGFEYWLRRTRPEGHKGARQTWLKLDNWLVDVRVIGRDHAWLVRRRLERKAEALRAECRRHTAAGQHEWEAAWMRYWHAKEDKGFQAFKAQVPGLIPTRGGRKPRATPPAPS